MWSLLNRITINLTIIFQSEFNRMPKNEYPGSLLVFESSNDSLSVFEWYSIFSWHFAGGQKTFTRRMNWTKLTDNATSGKKRCLIENRYLHIECIKNTLLMYKRFNACLIHTNAVQECYWIANSEIKIIMNGLCTIVFVYCLHRKFRMVLMTWRLALMKVRFSLLCDDWRIRMPKTVIECWLKWKIESYLCANDRILSLMNVTSRSCWPFHINKCVFSEQQNEQQKV